MSPAQSSPLDLKDCKPPLDSSWHLDLNELSKKTSNIIVGRLIEKDLAGNYPTLVPDVKPRGGVSVHGKRHSADWTFFVEKSLKGNYKKAEKIKFTSLLKDKDDTEDLLPFPLCDLVLNFEMKNKYIIFVDSYNLLGYQKYSKKLYKEIKNYLKKE